ANPLSRMPERSARQPGGGDRGRDQLCEGEASPAPALRAVFARPIPRVPRLGLGVAPAFHVERPRSQGAGRVAATQQLRRASRRGEEFEHWRWWQFIEAYSCTPNYQAVVRKITRALVAADPRSGSTRTLGDIFLQMVFDLAGLGNPPDRILNGPTSDVWLHPWR